MKKYLLSIALLISFSATTVYGAASAAQDQKSQAALDSADTKAAHADQSAAAKISNQENKTRLIAFAGAVQQAVPALLRDLCAVVYEYSKPSPLIFRNELPERACWQGGNLSRYDFMRFRFIGLDKTIYPAQEIDVAPELESWQIIPDTKFDVRTQMLHLGYLDPVTRRATVNKQGIIADEDLLWKGKRFCLLIKNDTQTVSLEQFDLDPMQGPDLEAKPEPIAKPVRPKVPIPARVLQSARKLNFS